ncbi:MAG TPA: hypothetical protein VE863_19060 [Pyrinomonadaceae bacterium]|jgi:hypothetical protein|nr:hypothetical protein [Pyrinomonadaceae bacterium]
MARFHFIVHKIAIRVRSCSAKQRFVKRCQNILILNILAALFTCFVHAQPRQPAGVYAKVRLNEAVASYTGPPENIHDCLRQLYRDLLSNPAIQGLTIGAAWDKIQTSDATYPDGYDFSYLDDAFMEAHNANPPKSVQLIITPGFDTPKWLLDQLPDCVWKNKVVQGPCGKQQWYKVPEESRSDSDRLPLPWDSKYKKKWYAFLEGLNTKYAADPAFVAVAVAGPVAGSDEMILPTSGNDKHIQPSGLKVNDTWSALIANSFPNGRYDPYSDQVFVDQWNDAIDHYEKIFQGVTVFLGPDAGGDFPEFPPSIVLPPPVDPTSWQAIDCQKTTTPMSCAAKTAILTHFLAATNSYGLATGKATQVGGMKASSPTDTGNIGVPGVKLLTSLAPTPTPLPTPILGGAAFDLPVSDVKFTQSVGCSLKPCPTLSPEEAAANVLAVFFDQTPFAKTFEGVQGKIVKKGQEPIHYLDVPHVDVQYAEAHPCPATPSAVLGYKSFMDQINDASYALLTMSNRPVPSSLLPPRASTCVHPGQDVTPPQTTAVASGPTGNNGWFTGPVVVDFTATDNASAIAETDYSLDGGTKWTPIICDNLYVTSDAIYDILYRSIDGANNEETPNSIHFKIDSTAPITTVSTRYVKVRGMTTSVLLTLTAFDNLSGVAKTEYSKDNGVTWIAGNGLALTTSGTYTILYRSIDVAGNMEQIKSITVNF